MSSIQTSKANLRKEIANKISQLTKEERDEQSKNVLEKLFKLPEFEKSERISVYLSTETEINTEPIIRRIFETNKLCFVPRYNGDVMEMVRLLSMEDWDNLPMTKWLIKQPKLSEKRESALEAGGLDLIILPGVGFTAGGKRLGHGKGYYDTFQTNLFKTQRQRPTTVALGFKEQVLDDLPTTERDVKIDVVLYSD